jgi:hypothetical protein
MKTQQGGYRHKARFSPETCVLQDSPDCKAACSGTRRFLSSKATMRPTRPGYRNLYGRAWQPPSALATTRPRPAPPSREPNPPCWRTEAQRAHMSLSLNPWRRSLSDVQKRPCKANRRSAPCHTPESSRGAMLRGEAIYQIKALSRPMPRRIHPRLSTSRWSDPGSRWGQSLAAGPRPWCTGRSPEPSRLRWCPAPMPGPKITSLTVREQRTL